MEIKMNIMHTDIKKLGKNIEKLSAGTVETEEREKIDIFQDLPLKSENDLEREREAKDTKLKNNVSYRNQMVSRMSTFQYYKIFEKKEGYQFRI